MGRMGLGRSIYIESIAIRVLMVWVGGWVLEVRRSLGAISRGWGRYVRMDGDADGRRSVLGVDDRLRVELEIMFRD